MHVSPLSELITAEEACRFAMKSLFVSPAYIPAWRYGGVVTSSARLMEELVALGIDVSVYTTDVGIPRTDYPPLDRPVMVNGVRIHYFKHDWSKPILSSKLNAFTRKTIAGFDILHLAGVWQPISLGVRRAAVRARCPYILSLHGALDPEARSRKRFKKWVYFHVAERQNLELAAGIRYTSEMEFEACRHLARPDQDQCIIGNGLDFAQWRRSPEDARQWRAKVGVPMDTLLILYVGRLHRIKGLDLAITALLPLREAKWHMALVGADADGAGRALAVQARNLGLADRLSFFPLVSASELPAIYSAADLFVLPSHHENFGNVALEALACGCPVLMSNQVGVAAPLGGIAGAVVRDRKVELWTEEFAASLARKSRAPAVTVVDRCALERRFSIRVCAEELIAMYRRLLAKQRTTTGSPSR